MDKFVIRTAKVSERTPSTSTSKRKHITPAKIPIIETESDKESADTESNELCTETAKKKKLTPTVRQLRPDWLEKFQWLKFEKNKAICKVCDKSVTNKKWNLQRHGKSDFHLEQVKAQKNVPRMEEAFTRVANKDNQKTTLVKCLAFITEHNLPISIMDHLPKFLKLVCPDSKIAQAFNCGRTKATEVLTDKIKPYCTKRMAIKLQHNYFSIIVDESTDISCKKCLVILARFFDNETNKITDHFLTILEIEDSTAECITNNILSFLEANEIPTSNVIGFCSDGASVMQGVRGGVQQLLKKKINKLYSITCTSHSLQICISNACSTLPTDIQELAKGVYSYLKNSPKRQNEMAVFQEYFEIKQNKIKKMIPTRWLSFGAVVKCILKNWTVLSHFFLIAATEDKCERARNIFNLLNEPKIKTYFRFLDYILTYTDQLNLSFQSEAPKLNIFVKSFSSFHKTILKNFLNEDYVNNLKITDDICYLPKNQKPLQEIFLGIDCAEDLRNLKDSDKTLVLEDCKEFYIKLSKEVIRKLNLSDGILNALRITDPTFLKMNQKISDILPHFNTLVTRFSQILECEKEVLFDEMRKIFDVEQIESMFDQNSTNFWVELGNMKNVIDEKMFPNISKFMIRLLVLPHGSASAERVFSRLNNIKTHNKNRLSYKVIDSLLSFNEIIKGETCQHFIPPNDLCI